MTSVNPNQSGKAKCKMLLKQQRGEVSREMLQSCVRAHLPRRRCAMDSHVSSARGSVHWVGEWVVVGGAVCQFEKACCMILTPRTPPPCTHTLTRTHPDSSPPRGVKRTLLISSAEGCYGDWKTFASLNAFCGRIRLFSHVCLVIRWRARICAFLQYIKDDLINEG